MSLEKSILEGCRLTGEFLLRSGQISHEYFDKYQFESQPELLEQIATALTPLLPKCDLLGAMEMGGIPIATALSLKTKKQMVLIRKEAKKYGTCKLAEGPEIKGQTICIIEDVITTGGQVVISANQLREQGATINHVIAVIDRSLGNHSKLKGANLELSSLITLKK